MLLHLGTCVSACPEGYLSDYDASYCYSLASLDIRLIPFPCLLIAIVFFFLTYVGSKQKRKHILISNWLVLMGLLVHGCLLSQVILNFKYGTAFYGLFAIIAYLCYVAANIVYTVMHVKKISNKDRLYSNWRNRPQNIFARRLMNIGGLLGSWNTYKLSYSGFWGFKLTPAKFSDPKTFRMLQKVFLRVNIGSVYALIILVNLIGCINMRWGTQLYIQMIENILIFGFMIWAGLWEQKKQETEYLTDSNYGLLKGRGKLNVMSVLDDQDMPEFSKTREHLLGASEASKNFTERKFEDLIAEFGDR
jgi:NADH:ubiquinone oxidoreductase subunit 6 (subunit J)